MNFDAFTSGVTPDGLKTQDEIRILICYLLKSTNSLIDRGFLVEICFENGFANYFETNEAITSLINNNNVTASEDGFLTLTDAGMLIADTFYSKLPITVRERAMNASLKLIARRKTEQENEVTIEKNKLGYLITCKIIDQDTTLLNFSITAADEKQAKTIKSKFLDDPTGIYSAIVDLMLNPHK